MKTNQAEKSKNKQVKNVTIEQLHKEFKKIKTELICRNNMVDEMAEQLDGLFYKSRKSVPTIFQTDSGHEIFKTFNLNVLPRVGEIMNLRPSPDSCCLNKYLMDEYNLSEQELTDHVLVNKTHFSFIVIEVTTNMFVADSHPEDEWDDCNAINFYGENDNMNYVITLHPNNKTKKEVLFEKIK